MIVCVLKVLCFTFRFVKCFLDFVGWAGGASSPPALFGGNNVVVDFNNAQAKFRSGGLGEFIH